MKTLIAIDGNSLMHRAYYALPNMTTKSGTPTGALHGFLAMLLTLVKRDPDYLVVAFDLHGPTFRHEKYTEYKAGRRETPEDLRPQFPMLQTLLKQMGIPVCTCEHFEADDILGTFSRICAEADVNALLVTGDRDALQLISPHTHVLLTKKGISETKEYDEAALLEDYGLAPDRMRDLKGLMGDSSDNIPGIPGVGEKTALKLLAEYQTIDNVLAHAGEIKGKLGEKIAANTQLAELSYWLGTIRTDAPLTMRLSDCAYVPAAMQEALPMLYDLELKAIAGRLPQSGSTPAAPAVPAAPTELISVTTLEALQALIPGIQSAKTVALTLDDTCLQLCFDGAAVYDARLSGTLLEPGLDAIGVLQTLAPVFESKSVTKVLFDAKRWMHVLKNANIRLITPCFDVMIADYLINAIRPAKTPADVIAERRMGDIPAAAALYRLAAPMEQELRDKGMEALFTDMEMPLAFVLFQMECEGFLVDAAILKKLGQDFRKRSDSLAEQIYELCGEQFNILSPKQLGTILFEKLGLPAGRKTKTGYSTDADALEKLTHLHPAVPMILEYRFLTKLTGTFVDGLLNAQDKSTGRVRTSLNQTVTATGRISSTEPNLQNIPVRTQQGREIRRAFIASPGNVLVGADYSQIELRLLAHISGDETMKQAFLSGGDIHTRTAAEVFGVPPADVTGEQRSAAKAVNFGIVYGISDFGLAKNLGISRTQAKDYIARYFERYPGVKAYLDKSVETGKAQGYAATLCGRRRDLPELKSSNFNTRGFGERVAMNMPIQGTAADIIKLAMVKVAQALKDEGLQAKLVLQVHDELIVDTPAAEEQAVRNLLSRCMEGAMPLSVPLVAEVKSGQNWYETK